MRVSYRSYRGCIYEQVGMVHFCCREMQDEWGVLVGFGIKEHLRSTSRAVNIFTSHHM